MTQNSGAPAVTASHIRWNYGKQQVLRDAGLYAFQGDCVGIAGINGSGKSTLLSILAGIRKAKGGSFVCYGTDMWQNKKRARTLMGYLPQTNPLMEEMTVSDNLRLWTGKTISPSGAVCRELQIRDMLSKKVNKLSGGMKRRVAIACAIAHDPAVLLMDEPTTSLDLYHRELIHDYIRGFTARGGIVIMSTHDPSEMQLCNRLFYLENGVLYELSLLQVIQRLKGGTET